MRNFYLILMALAVLNVSCMKDMGSEGKSPEISGNISPDFDWKMTQDVQVAVGVPSVDGIAPEYAVVRIYSSPVLSDANTLAKGVAKTSAPFRTAFTLAKGARNVYVEATLPDGTKSVKMVAAQKMIDVAPSMKSTASASSVRLALPQTRAESSMPALPEMPVFDQESDFAAEVVIRENPSSKLDLGASWAAPRVADKYFIPKNAVITANLDLNGGWAPYGDPVLYVAGTLKFSSLGIGRAQLVVLPGGVVEIGSLNTNGTGRIDKPTIYIFEGGSVTLGSGNMGSKCIVNRGTLVFEGDLDLNNSAGFFNTGDLKVAGEIKGSNSVKIYNDGVTACEDLKLNSNAELYNCENAKLTVGDECVFERNTTIYQRGEARFNEMTARGTLYVNCYTVVDEMDAEGADIRFGAGAALETEKAEFNNTDVSLAAGAMFIATEYNAERTGGKNNFTFSGDGTSPVVLIKDKAYTKQGHDTYFSGPMEVVYDNEKYAGEKKPYVIDKKYLIDGAVLRAAQTVLIPSSPCNGGKEPVTPDPEPEPSEEYSLSEGAVYTCCFEDNWPYFGDYDMNDVVVVTRIDRMLSKDGSKVASVDINWELKAAGTTYDIAFAVQMKGVRTDGIASTSSTHKAFGDGAFVDQNPEAGNDLAVIPFFNKTSEVLAVSNTWKDQPAGETIKHKTTVVFTQPVDVNAVTEENMNFFIAAKSRANEIHMPNHEPTAFAVIANGSFLPNDPYRFFDVTGDRKGSNYMMWALMIPGDFRYPAENKDIRSVYKFFLPWAESNGKFHPEWYNEDADESKVF